MGYAIELYFNAEADTELLSLRDALAGAGIPDILGRLGARPHVSLAVFSAADYRALLKLTNVFAACTDSFDITLSHIGAFPTTEGIVFVGPTPTTHLLALHHTLHRVLSDAGIQSDPYYRPEQWTPHCTTATDMTPTQMATAARVCVEKFRPVHATCVDIGLVSFRPVVSLGTYPLQGANR